MLFAQQMWAFVMIHELPYDDPTALRRRLKIRYPIRIDRAIGGGTLPNTRLQSALMRPAEEVSGLDRALTFAHWAWFFEPHLTLVFILARDHPGFVRAARQMALCFDLGCATYIAVPTAPPWWAAEHGYTGDDRVHRRMLEVGEETWGRAWPKLYDSVDGNPWAAMPSLHFGASVLAAILLTRVEPAGGRRRLDLRRRPRPRPRLSRRALRDRPDRRARARRRRCASASRWLEPLVDGDQPRRAGARAARRTEAPATAGAAMARRPCAVRG